MSGCYTTKTTIAAPAEAVWDVINDLGNMDVATGMADRVEISTRDGVPLRTLHLTPALGGGVVAEKITLIDNAKMHMNYEVVDFGPLPATSYKGFMKFIPDGAKTILDYEARYEGSDIDALGAMAKGNIDMLVTNIETAVANAKR
ncbi:SRPBCC family protein [Vitreimonas flagellata]|uniref:SRPBCC family protein n=1 Tax=Vitreimonas flagellata TaxID=2560861 RepID=UPI0010753A42|nr:SRPBCC family protein [Vitreimonas flagellata]